MEYTDRGAQLSADEKYRYLLWREWRGTGTERERRVGDDPPWTEPLTCLFVMLNPSTADGTEDDPTIRRCVDFARRWNYRRMEVVNLFAYRATKPVEILRLNDKDEPCGYFNQEFIEGAARDAGMIVCAWGSHGTHLDQDQTVLGWIQRSTDLPLHVLAFTGNGQPRHPLYVAADTKPIVWEEVTMARA